MSLTLNVRFDQDGSESHSKGGPQADSPTIFGEGKVCGVIELHGEVKAGDSGFVELVLDGKVCLGQARKLGLMRDFRSDEGFDGLSARS